MILTVCPCRVLCLSPLMYDMYPLVGSWWPRVSHLRSSTVAGMRRAVAYRYARREKRKVRMSVTIQVCKGFVASFRLHA